MISTDKKQAKNDTNDHEKTERHADHGFALILSTSVKIRVNQWFKKMSMYGGEARAGIS